MGKSAKSSEVRSSTIDDPVDSGRKAKKSHKHNAKAADPKVAASDGPELVVKEECAIEEQVGKLKKEIKALRYRMALCEGFDIVKRFRHHLMYDLVKKFEIDVPLRMNTKKRTNFPILLKAIENAGSKVPAQWQNAIRGLKKLEEAAQFPMGFWDSVDNSAVTAEMIEVFVSYFDEPELQSQVRDMCECSLTCTPPCARGNGNSPKKGDKCESMSEIKSTAKAILNSKGAAKSSKKKSKEDSSVSLAAAA